jgi:hypothetical protein
MHLHRFDAVVKSRLDSFVPTPCTYKYKILIEHFEGENLLADRGVGLGVQVVLKRVKVRLDRVIWIHRAQILVHTIAAIPFP